jgi:ankyrin repeat protein
MEFSESDCQHSFALYHAAKAGQVELVQQLLDKGAWKDYPWSYPLPNAMVNYLERVMAPGDLKIFWALLRTGNPLAAAASKGHTDVCTLLLKKRVHTPVVHQALCRAAAGGHLAVVRLMAEENHQFASDAFPGHVPGAFLGSKVMPSSSFVADVNEEALPYPTCLVAAAAGGNPAIVQLLLDLGVSFGQHWEQALAEATSRGHSEMVRLLLSKAPPGQGRSEATAVGGGGQGGVE